MKKSFLALLLVAAMTMSTGCGSKNETQNREVENEQAPTATPSTGQAASEAASTEQTSTETSMGQAASEAASTEQTSTETSIGQTASEAASTETVSTEAQVLNFGSFTSTDLDGNEVTNAIFSEKDLTIVNVWGTFCGPCINEMPELGEWNATLPDNIQLLGFIIDVYGPEDTEQVALAKSLVEKTGASFTHILLSQDCLDTVLSQVTAVPTTLFLDPDGNVLDVIVGANVEGYKEYVTDFLATQE